jgi:trigger factor
LPGLNVTDDEMQRQLDRLRENDAELEVVDRPAIDGDLVTIDLHGNDASGAEVVGVDDYLYEVGTGTVVAELDNELHGAKAGAILAFDAANPTEPDERVAFRVLVKEVKVKRLPEVTDEWASESSEFDTVSELRADIEKRIGQVKLIQSQMALRQKSIEALAGLVAEDAVPEVLVDAEVNERLHDLQHRLEGQKMGLAEYFQATGTSPDELLAAVRVDAEAAVKADLALRALVEAEEVALSDEELDAEIERMAERFGTTPDELRRQLDTGGRTGAVRSELRKSKALEWLLDHVALFDEEGNPMSRDDLKVDASGEGEVEQNEESE